MLNWKLELDKILECSWPDPDPLRPVSDKGVILYGAGQMGEMALALMGKNNLLPRYIVDSKKIGFINDVAIISPDILSKYEKENLTFIICIASVPVNPVFDYLKEIGCVDVRHFYDYSEIEFSDIMPNGWFAKESDTENIKRVLEILGNDEKSVAHYLQFLWWRICRKEVIYNEHPVLSGKKLFKSSHLNDLSSNERYLDGGAHEGEIILDFIDRVQGQFGSIWAFEPDSYNLQVMKHKCCNYKIDYFTYPLTDYSGEEGFLEGCGYASKIDDNNLHRLKTFSLDDLPNINPSIIKFHIEGNELKALKGAEKCIKTNKPILMILADHNVDGLYRIPIYINSFGFYSIYFNLHDYCGNSAVYYAIPKK